jgi:hypothetical protein
MVGPQAPPRLYQRLQAKPSVSIASSGTHPALPPTDHLNHKCGWSIRLARLNEAWCRVIVNCPEPFVSATAAAAVCR